METPLPFVQKFFVLVEALLRVLYGKIQHEGWGQVINAPSEAECCICHETPP